MTLLVRPGGTLNDVMVKTTESEAAAHPVRKVPHSTGTTISVDLPVYSEDVIQPSGFAAHFRVPRMEPKRHPNTHRKIKDSGRQLPRSNLSSHI